MHQLLDCVVRKRRVITHRNCVDAERREVWAGETRRSTPGICLPALRRCCCSGTPAFLPAGVARFIYVVLVRRNLTKRDFRFVFRVHCARSARSARVEGGEVRRECALVHVKRPRERAERGGVHCLEIDRAHCRR